MVNGSVIYVPRKMNVGKNGKGIVRMADWTDYLDEAIEQAFGHTDWRVNDSKSVIVYREPRICYLQEQELCPDSLYSVKCGCDQCIKDGD